MVMMYDRMNRRRLWAGVWIATAVAGAFGCNAILGFEEAKVDPSLSAIDNPDSGDGGEGDADIDGATADAGSDAGTPCERYCGIIMTNCIGNNAEYLSPEVCLAMCSHFEPGIPGDTHEDSLECRTYHAGAAKGDPNYHCRHAGPLGGGHCGLDPCRPYCLLDFALCGSLVPPPFDGGESGCFSECTNDKFTYLTAGDAGDITLTAGNTLNCRLYHLESAYNPTSASAKTTHCPHTATISATCN
jgi:hypothetical protein